MSKTLQGLLLLLLGASLCLAQADDFSGTYEISGEGGVAYLVLLQNEAGQVSGALHDGVTTIELFGSLVEDGVLGDAQVEGGGEMAFAVQRAGEGVVNLALVPYGEDGQPALDQAVVLVLTQAEDEVPGTEDPVEEISGPVVFINGVRLDADTIAILETRYGTPVQEGRYWYDSACGAWGVESGPAAGLIVPGLPLPGPMPPGISGTGSGIFINGREIHELDKQGLIAIFGEAREGHYWLDAQGNIGEIGGPALVNLFAAIRAAQEAYGGGGSVTHGYDSTYGSRGTLAGGMYSGRTASGKSVFWYPGM